MYQASQTGGVAGGLFSRAKFYKGFVHHCGFAVMCSADHTGSEASETMQAIGPTPDSSALSEGAFCFCFVFPSREWEEELYRRGGCSVGGASITDKGRGREWGGRGQLQFSELRN